MYAVQCERLHVPTDSNLTTAMTAALYTCCIRTEGASVCYMLHSCIQIIRVDIIGFDYYRKNKRYENLLILQHSIILSCIFLFRLLLYGNSDTIRIHLLEAAFSFFTVF